MALKLHKILRGNKSFNNLKNFIDLNKKVVYLVVIHWVRSQKNKNWPKKDWFHFMHILWYIFFL